MLKRRSANVQRKVEPDRWIFDKSDDCRGKLLEGGIAGDRGESGSRDLDVPNKMAHTPLSLAATSSNPSELWLIANLISALAAPERNWLGVIPSVSEEVA